jgi:hypothetical protein
MGKITLNGEMDHLFTDDRDGAVEKMTAKERVPSYGSNSLYRPKRALTPEEAELVNRIGTPTPSSDGKPR